MKSNYRYIVKAFMAMAVIAGTTSCDDFLDREPMSSISPETYYSTAAQLEANLNDEYPNVLPSFGQWTYGIFGEDKGTDNQIEVNANDRYTQHRNILIDTGRRHIDITHIGISLVKIGNDETCHFITRKTFAGFTESFHLIGKRLVDNREVAEQLELLKVLVSTQEVHFSDIVLDGGYTPGNCIL